MPSRLAFALLPFLAAPLAAQSVTGRVVRPSDGDTVPVSGVRVVLHRVTKAEQGPLDSMPSGANGRFRFGLERDTAALYLLSARYQGIEYFTVPLDRTPERPESVTVVVHDTSSQAPVTLSARHVVIPRPGEDGTREVLDLVLLANAGTRTRVAPDSLGASWGGVLPPESEGLDLGESDVSPDAVTRRGDSVIVSAPISPGEKQLALQYHLLPGRGRTVELPVGSERVALNVLVEESGATVSGPGLSEADSEMLEGRSFRRWSGEVPANSLVRISLPGAGAGSAPVIAALVAVLALALLAAAWRMLPGRAPAAGVPGRHADADLLLNQIAALDARYQGREAEISADEWTRYRERRAALKADAAAALARGPRTP